MLYLAFPQDLRDRYKDSTWLTHTREIEDTQFTPDDTLVLAWWTVTDQAELIHLAYRARQRGTRVIYVGPTDFDTADLKQQLCLMGIYDFLFFKDEIVLGRIDDLIEHPRTPADVREFLPQDFASPNAQPAVVEVTDEDEPAAPHGRRGLRDRLRGGSRWGKTSPPSTVRILQPRLVCVVGVWPRAGTTTISYLLAKRLAERLPPNSVTCVEHPKQWGRMWEHFQLDKHLPAEQYHHWLQGADQTIEVDGVSLVPLPPGFEGVKDDAQTRMVEYIFRQRRRPVTVLDCGQNIADDMLLGMADHIVCVLDCDPTYLSVKELGKKYEYLTGKHPGRVVTVLNKWTRFAQYEDLFEDAVKVPYLSPERMQQALWDGQFINISEVDADLQALTMRLVQPLSTL